MIQIIKRAVAINGRTMKMKIVPKKIWTVFQLHTNETGQGP